MPEVGIVLATRRNLQVLQSLFDLMSPEMGRCKTAFVDDGGCPTTHASTCRRLGTASRRVVKSFVIPPDRIVLLASKSAQQHCGYMIACARLVLSV